MADDILTVTLRPFRKLKDRLWAKREGQNDERPCGIPGCGKEGFFLPIVHVWKKSDPKHEDRFFTTLIPLVLCTDHARDIPASEYKPDATALVDITKALGEEPDLDSKVVQFVGNDITRVDYSAEDGKKRSGLYEHYYDSKPADGGPAGIRTRKLS